MDEEHSVHEPHEMVVVQESNQGELREVLVPKTSEPLIINVT